MTRSKARFLSVAAAATFVLGAAQAARAQSIDYGSLEQLFDEPVTTSATGSPQRATDVPVDMSIITAADIQRSGATDLPTATTNCSGVGGVWFPDLRRSETKASVGVMVKF